jgi:hypothetical protein
MYQFLASQLDCPPARLAGLKRCLFRAGEAARAREAKWRLARILAKLDARTLYDIGASDISVSQEASPIATHNPYVLAVRIMTAWDR